MKPLASVLPPILALAVAAAGAYLWSQYAELVALRAALPDPAAGRALARQIAQTQKDLGAAKRRLAALASSDAPDPNDTPEVAAEKKARRLAKRQTIEEQQARFAELMQSPEARRLQMIQNRGWFEQHNAPLLRALGLPPEQTEKLHDLLLEQNESFQDAYFLAKEQGIDPATDPKGFGAIMSGIATQSTNEIKAAIGDDAYAQYQKLSSGQGQIAVASQLQQSLSYTASPLTDAQAAQLAQILAQNTTPAHDPDATAVLSEGGSNRVTLRGGSVGVISASGGVQGVAPMSDAAVTAAAAVLSPAQLDALKQLQQVQQSQLQLGQILAPAMPKSQLRTGTVSVTRSN